MDKLKRLIELKEAHQRMDLNEDDYIGIAQVIDEAIKREESGDKEKPMKPDKYRTEGDFSQNAYDCGVCGGYVGYLHEYCCTCGQKLDWEAIE